ncbi:MAG: response regulator [Coriobacteriales bacterium]|nr:response regulator [Coriobacteriales bacterium]
MKDQLILVVDDVAFMRRMIRASLFEVGFTRVDEASDGVEAVEHYRERHPDLVILDITMKNKHGLDTLGEIMEFDPAAKVIMCTAIDQQQTVMEALKLGAADLIVKPFQKHELMHAVLTVLGN